ncbi:MAG TPA: hypothetical protein VMV97_00950 [Sulfuriferula sp.]|nr:hypothetical protein [Sulfuriferula sp.]
MLFFATGIGKTKVNELNIVFFDQFHYVGYRHLNLLIKLRLHKKDASSAGALLQQKTCQQKWTHALVFAAGRAYVCWHYQVPDRQPG